MVSVYLVKSCSDLLLGATDCLGQLYRSWAQWRLVHYDKWVTAPISFSLPSASIPPSAHLPFFHPVQRMARTVSFTLLLSLRVALVELKQGEGCRQTWNEPALLDISSGATCC